ncbi:MAG: metallophosphoesterase [SAR324 cluster bacterium]|nr:metallophosphoesterase [SAR324 cluster bacterium]
MSSSPASFAIQQRSSINPLPGSRTTVVVAASSDLHGWLSTDTLFPEEEKRGVLHIAPIIKQLRDEYPHLILLDAGDILQGSPSAFYFNFHSPAENPLPIVKLMNHLQYDAVALGNHDLEPPPGVLQKNMMASQFTWLAANLLKTGEGSSEGDPVLPPYRVLERAGVRIGIMGLLTPGTSMWVNKSHLNGMRIEGMFAATQKWVPILKEQEQVDLLVGLFHSGHNFRYDQYVSLNQGVPVANASGIVADSETRFDLIISGHAHRLFPKRKTSELRHFRTPLISPGFWGYGVSVVKFFLKEEGARWQIEKSEYSFISASPEPSEQLGSMVKADMDQVRQYLDVPTRVVLHQLPSKENFFQCGADLSHQAILGRDPERSFSLFPARWRWKKLLRNELGAPLKRLHLFRWLPYDNFPVLSQLYGRQIQILLDPYLRQQRGLSFRSNSLLAPGGFQAILSENEDGASSTLKHMETSLSLSESFPVWMSNYHWNGGGGLVGEALVHPTQKIKEIGQTLRDLLFAYLQRPAKLSAACLTFLKNDYVMAKIR